MSNDINYLNQKAQVGLYNYLNRLINGLEGIRDDTILAAMEERICNIVLLIEKLGI